MDEGLPDRLLCFRAEVAVFQGEVDSADEGVVEDVYSICGEEEDYGNVSNCKGKQSNRSGLTALKVFE